MTDDLALKRMYWHSRRGMLELDLLLVPFAEAVLPTLSQGLRDDYARLLGAEDQDLYQWLVKRVPVPEESLQDIVDTILTLA